MSLCLSTYKNQKESILERRHSYINFYTAYGQKFRLCIFLNDMGSREFKKCSQICITATHENFVILLESNTL